MSVIHRLRRSRYRRGGTALAGALMLLPLSLIAGIGIDFGRAWLAQERLGQAVDAAALAGARVLGSRDPSIDARAFFDANLPGDSLVVESFLAASSADGQTLDVTARGRLPMTFLRLAGSDWATLPVYASARARRTTMGMEIALVLDVTGSMAGTPMTQMRLAAADLVNILFGSKATLDTLFVSVVPYSMAVNIGPQRGEWLASGAAPASDFAPFRWRGCVEARSGTEDLTDTPPSIAPFSPFLFRSTRSQTAANAFGYRSGTTQPAYGDNDWGTAPAITSSEKADADDGDSLDPNNMSTPANERKGPNVGCPQPIAGLTNERDQLLSIIRALQLSYRGGTMGNLGLQAGWMTISPQWRGLWGTSPWGTVTPAGLPLDYPTKRSFMSKVIVIMTDGDNDWYDYPRPPKYDYTGYGRLSEGRLGTTDYGTAKSQVNNRMATLCTRIKAQGVTIYTITLGTAGATQTLYRNCATGPGYYFNAPSAADLRTAFREIGSQLSNLRLEK